MEEEKRLTASRIFEKKKKTDDAIRVKRNHFIDARRWRGDGSRPGGNGKQVGWLIRWA